jgi:hypothetical protein
LVSNRLKKNFIDKVKSVLPLGVELSRVQIWFQDDHRIGQQGSLTRIWALKEIRPRISRQQQFIAAYMFGAICPQEDKGVAVIMPHADTLAMQIHLDEIAQQVDKGKHAVIILDKAGWHVSKKLKVPENISFYHCLLILLNSIPKNKWVDK